MAKYSNKIVNQIVELISSDSYTIAEVCKNVGITKDTYYNWLKSKSDFSDAIKKAEESRNDYFKVEAKKSLLKKIQGYTADETKTIYIDGKEGRPKIKEQTIIKKHIQPDTVAIIFTLTNQDPDNWKNKQSSEVTGKDGKDLFQNFDFSKLTTEEIKQYEKLLTKAQQNG